MATAGYLKKARDDARQDLREKILAEALRVVAHHGPEALSTRKIAAAVGCSTTMIYAFFESKNGLVQALYWHGFEMLSAAFAAASDRVDPLDRARAICRAYRAFAAGHPGHYRIMYGGGPGDFQPDAASRELAWSTLQALIDALSASVAAGNLADRDPVLTARMLWASMHGLVTLEMGGLYLDRASADAVFEGNLNAVLDGLVH